MSGRVVITGMGVVSSIGIGREAFWRSSLEGRSGCRRLETPWAAETDVATRIAAPVVGFDPKEAGIEPRLARFMDPTNLFAVAAAREALADAGLPLVAHPEKKRALTIDGVDPWRVATAVGSGIGGIASLEISHAAWREQRSKKPVKRYSLPMIIPNASAGQVAIHVGAMGECKSLCTACAAGTMSIGDAWRLLRDGEADVALAGGTENVAGDEDAYCLMGFDRLQTMSTRNDEPERASRPFDRDRDGFVLGEGAGILVLEREEHARARGAVPWAEVAGYASNCDAHSMMQPDDSGRMIVALMRSALESAGVSQDDVDHVNAHGTSTLMNDKTESRALRELFGKHADDISVTAVKSMTGHAIAASGPIETVAAAMTLRHGIITPTVNYETPDPECDVDVVANRPREAQVSTVLKMSYGFGGHNACLVLRRWAS